MSGIASVVLLFWATMRPPSEEQLRHGLLVISAVCFVVGSYRIWVREHERYLTLTKRTQGEVLEDAIKAFMELEQWYGNDEPTTPKKLNALIEETTNDLRHHAPNFVLSFKKSASDQSAFTAKFFPERNRTMEELVAWRSDKVRENCWRTAAACVYQLKSISVDVHRR